MKVSRIPSGGRTCTFTICGRTFALAASYSDQWLLDGKPLPFIYWFTQHGEASASILQSLKMGRVMVGVGIYRPNPLPEPPEPDQ